MKCTVTVTAGAHNYKNVTNNQVAEFAVVSELMSFTELTCAKQNGKELTSIKLKLETALCVPLILASVHPHTAWIACVFNSGMVGISGKVVLSLQVGSNLYMDINTLCSVNTHSV